MPSTVVCPSCGKRHAYRADLAGKRVQCACGNAVSFPDLPADGQEDELYDLAYDPELAKQQAVRKTVMPRQETGIYCPECSGPIEAGSVICGACGFNLKTGERVASAAAPAAKKKSGARRLAGIPPALAGKQVPEQSRADALKKIGILAGIAVLVAIAVLALQFARRGGDQAQPPADPDDEVVREALEDHSAHEAREWLKQDQRMISGMTQGQAQSRVDDWYRMGAKNVYFFGGLMVRQAALELPSEPAKRKAIFDWQARWHGEMKQPVRADKGQRYLIIQLRF